MFKKIKVMHFVSGLLSGGVEQMLYNYYKFIDHDKYEFMIVYQHEPVQNCKEKIESIGCQTIRITARNENFFKNLVDSYRVIKAYNPDIIHAHMNLMNFCALFPARFAKVNIRISHAHIAEKNKNILYQTISAICKLLNIISASDLWACGYEAGYYMYGKKRVLGNKVKYINNAIDLDYFKKDKNLENKFREKYNIKDKFIIGHVGRFTYQKNHEKVIKVFMQVLEKKKDAVLLLVGNGEREEEIRKMVIKMELEDRVLFLGTTSDMASVYSSMDAFILPSRYEGFPIVAIEVQAADIPSVFSNTIDKACKITEAIKFLPLKEDDSVWAETILNFAEKKKKGNLSKLQEIYDIRKKARDLDNYYREKLY